MIEIYDLFLGRWTKEEHLTFIKGLELYGKGWKKIANLVKTRTGIAPMYVFFCDTFILLNYFPVVQIRTHAQKYFLKLAKSRQSGETSGGNIVSSDGRSVGPNTRKVRVLLADSSAVMRPALTLANPRCVPQQRKMKRRSDRSIAVAPALQPFLRPTANLESLRPNDIDDGLYNFLSPNFTIAVPTEAGLQMHTLPTQAFSATAATAAPSAVSWARSDGEERAGIPKPSTSDGAHPPASSSSSSGTGTGAALTVLEDMDAEATAAGPVPRLLMHSSMRRLGLGAALRIVWD